MIKNIDDLIFVDEMGVYSNVKFVNMLYNKVSVMQMENLELKKCH